MTNKNWFKLRGVEYSANIRYFKEHDLMISRSGNIVKFCSRKETYLFKEVDAINASLELAGYDEDKITEEIHTNLLQGRYGVGEFIN